MDRITLASGLDVAYLDTGGGGPLAVCLTGSPTPRTPGGTCSPSWRRRGTAPSPWLRGYAPTALPADGRYQSGAIAVDAIELHEALGGGGDAVVIGHDWGARAATGAAALAPDRWHRIVTMAVPPRGAVAEEFLTFRQLTLWYMFFFQHVLADLAVPLDDLAFIDRLGGLGAGLHRLVRRPAMGQEEALAPPRTCPPRWATTEATLQPELQAPELAEAEAAVASTPPQPHLYLHGVDDGCMGVELAERAAAYLTVEGSRVELVPSTGRFLHLEAPDTVNRLVLDFLTD